MHPHEIVMREVQRYGCAQVLDLLGEGICQPREPTHRHPHSQVLPLNEACRDMVLIGVASDHDPLPIGNLGRGIAARPDRLCVVKFNLLPVIDIRPECALYCVHIGRERIRGNLPERFNA